MELIPYESNLEMHCELSAKWLNDERIRHLFRYVGFRPENPVFETVTLDEVRGNYARSRLSGKYYRWMIGLEDHVVGEVSLQIDPTHKITPLPQTGWISIVIGEPQQHRSGLGTQALKLLEERAKTLGCRRIELGTFEFNQSAHRFYVKNGYQEVTRLPDFVYWNDRSWSDIRMIKEFS